MLSSGYNWSNRKLYLDAMRGARQLTQAPAFVKIVRAGIEHLSAEFTTD
jgi:hypothetical protein